MKKVDWKGCRTGGRAAIAAGSFAAREAVVQRLQQGPGPEAQQVSAVTAESPAPSRWTLRTIRATFAALHAYTLSGVWRWLHERIGVRLRSAVVQQYSPDPQ